jgi:RimJ/RimL family protein N-acetyltransferase/protein associated with RNAse G/E
MSQSVTYQSVKYDGSVNYRWTAQLEYARSNLIILCTPGGTPFTGRRAGTAQHAFRSYLWTDRWFNVNQTHFPEPDAGIRHYVNIATPATFDGSTVSYVDLDLDFDLDNRWNLTLLDEDEYAAHIAHFNYSAHVRQNVEKAILDVRRAVQSRAWPFATAVEGDHVRLRPFFWADLGRMDQWRGAYTPIDDPWIIPAPGTFERREWYWHYVETPVTRLYAIDNCAGELVGHISLREITPASQARLGIGLAPGEVGRGYGTEALRMFLPYYFDVLGFERIVLDVAASNVRAVRAYERVGFKRYSDHFRGASEGAYWHIHNQPQNSGLKTFFRRTAWGFQQLYYDMDVTRDAWHAGHGGE